MTNEGYFVVYGRAGGAIVIYINISQRKSSTVMTWFQTQGKILTPMRSWKKLVLILNTGLMRPVPMNPVDILAVKQGFEAEECRTPVQAVQVSLIKYSNFKSTLWCVRIRLMSMFYFIWRETNVQWPKAYPYLTFFCIYLPIFEIFTVLQ